MQHIHLCDGTHYSPDMTSFFYYDCYFSQLRYEKEELDTEDDDDDDDDDIIGVVNVDIVLLPLLPTPPTRVAWCIS